MVCASGSVRPMSEAAMAEIISTRLRPKRSERIEAGTTQIASIPVATETVSAATVGVVSKASTSAGSIAWVTYSPLNTASPAAKTATVANR